MVSLEGQSEIKHDYIHDELTGLTTINFFDSGGSSLGSFTIETVRFRPFMKTLSNIADEQFNDLVEGLVFSRTSFNLRDLKAVSKY